MAEAATGKLSRRRVLETGLRLGLATPVIAALWDAAPAGASTSAVKLAHAPGAMQDQATGTFTILRDGSSPDIDPHTAYDNLSSMLFFGLYEMLVQYMGSATDEIAPMLAESWETSEDGLAVTFNLDRPSPLFLPAMASSYGPFVVNPKMVEENKTEEDPWAHEWFLANASGTGPYFLEENLPTEQVIMTKFAEYHGGWERPHFDRLLVRIVEEAATRRQLLETGDADAAANNLTPDDVESMSTKLDLKVEVYESTAVFWVIMNAPRLLTPEARQGFSYAFPYDDVVNSAYRGLVTRTGPLASTVIGYDPDVFLYQTDLVRAKELILSAGFKQGDTFDYMFQSGDEVERVIAQLFQAKVSEMGFNLELLEVKRAALVDSVYGDAPAGERPMFYGGWGWWPDHNDPFNQLDPNFSPKDGAGISNGGWWVNERFSELMAMSANFQSDDELIDWMEEIQGFVPNSLYLSAFNFVDMYREASA